nr:MAG TPA: hypothetical protein [Bacteriophage sp.]
MYIPYFHLLTFSNYTTLKVICQYFFINFFEFFIFFLQFVFVFDII